MKLTVSTFLSLDGVMQGPGGVEEDRSGGFDRGGWLVPHADADMGRIVSGWLVGADAILLGRTTYEMMRAYWTQVTDPDDVVATQLNNRPKYVVSTTLADASWHNSTVIGSDVLNAVARLKAQPGRDLQVHGSCRLARSLHDHGLVDEYRLIVFPVVVGAGKRLFPDGCVPLSVSLVDTQVTSAGAVALTFRPTAARAAGEYAVVDGKGIARPADR
jgi:dihydrofolate reductase